MQDAQARCNFASITKCDEDGLASVGLRECHRSKKLGMHHHYCATHKLARGTAEDPAGLGTSLYAKCGALLVNESIAGDNNDGGGERAAPLPVESKHTAAIGMDKQADAIAQDDADESAPVEEDTAATA
eukprot:714760-Pleurochrysis_carterae.AAC.1